MKRGGGAPDATEALLRVSVIMPVYNGGDYFKLAIESVLAQTYPVFEIVIINDGSADGGHTARVAEHYRDTHPKLIRYLSGPNGGVASALNRGIATMAGQFFCWLSHDDLFLPEKLERQVEMYRRLGNPDAVLFSDYQLIDQTGTVRTQVIFDHSQALARPRLPLLRGWVNGCTIFMPAHLFAGRQPFDPTYRYVQDYRTWAELLKKYEFFHQPEVLVSYRQHSQQDSHLPAAVEEGEALWEEMLAEYGVVERAQVSGSSWLFFDEGAAHLKDSPYLRAANAMASRRDCCLSESLVSVVMPVFNEEPLAIRALKSIQAQTHGNLEILLIDDGSTTPLDQLECLVEADPRARLIRQTNQGPGAARNLGLKHSTGEYIAFLDSDDEFLSEKIERQVEAMQLGGALISHTSYYVRYEGRPGTIGVMSSGRVTGNIYPQVLSTCGIATPTVMIHRLLIAEGFRFIQEIRMSEDVLAWIDSAARHPVLGLDDALSIVEWSDQSAALDAAKSLQGARAQLRYLQSDLLHANEPMLEGLVTYRDEVERKVAAGLNSRDDVLDLAFAGRRRTRARLSPRQHFDPSSFRADVRRRTLITSSYAAALDQQVADLIVSLSPHDFPLVADHNMRKHLLEGSGAVFSSGTTPWDFVAAFALDPAVMVSALYVELECEAADKPVYVLLVDEGYSQLGERVVLEPGRSRSLWIAPEAGSAAYALVIQAGERPRGERISVTRLTAHLALA